MKKFLRTISAVLACVIVLSLAGCKSQEEKDKYIAEYDGIKMETGIYVVQMMGAYMEAVELVEDPQGDILKQEIDGQNAKEWIVDKTKSHMAENFAIVSKFNEKGLELKEDEINYINQVSEQQWMYLGSSYSQSGVTKDDLVAINTINMQASALFENVYGEGGEKAVPETEIRPIYEENYLKVSYLPVYKFAADGTPLEGDDLIELEKSAKDYYNRLNSGEDMETLTAEYQEILEAEQQALQEKIEAEMKAQEEAEADETDADVTEENDEDDNDKVIVKADAEEKPETEEAEADETAEDEDTEDAEETEEVEEEVPAKHTMVFHKDNQQIFDAEFVEDVIDAKDGETIFFENEQYYIIAVKEDINEDEEDYNEKVLEITLELKSEEFSSLITEWAKDIEPKYDSILTAEHSPKFLAFNNNQQQEEEEPAEDDVAEEDASQETEDEVTDETAETSTDDTADADTEAENE